MKLIPEHWKSVLEEIQKEKGGFSGLTEAGKWGKCIGILESLRARRLVERNAEGYYSITAAGEAVLQEEHDQGILMKISKRSDILNDIRKEIRQRERYLKKRLSQKRTVAKSRDYRNIFVVAKLWNSATPIFPAMVDSPQTQMPDGGGGYILLWDNLCLCIDPGLNFLARFYSRGLTPNDIDGVIITHDHLDHTRDVEGLLSLLYERYKLGMPRPVCFLASQGTLVKYKKLLDFGVAKGYIKKVLLRPGQLLCLPEWHDKMALRVTRAIHKEIYANASVGLVFELKQTGKTEIFKLGITGDTAWNQELYSAFSETDLLIAHLGTVEKKDDEFLEQHLGVKGIGLLICGIKPKLTIVTEFGEEVGEKRVSLCKTLSQITECTVLPGEMGMEISIPQLKARKTIKRNFQQIPDFMEGLYEDKDS